MNKPELSSFTTKTNLQLQASFYRAAGKRKNTTVIYFHGGGLLYGVRDDLPEIYISQILAAGYDFLALDYPLAPESKLDEILRVSFETLCFYLKNIAVLHQVENHNYVLFGRSAGAYLCFMLCDLLIKANASLPLAIISLYGYARLDEIQFQTPSKFYNAFPAVPAEGIEHLLSDKPVTSGPMSSRFSLYVKARQEGTWLQYLCGSEDPAKYSLAGEALRAFPPSILAAATMDPDVPYKMTKTLYKQIPNSHLITVYGQVHDFDRDVTDPAGSAVYTEIIQWLGDRR